VNERFPYVAGEGTLTYGRVLHEALGMFRRHYRRVALVALLLFVPPPLLLAVLEGFRDSIEAEPGLIRGLGYVIGLLMVTLIRLFGPVVYAGYLDEAVGHEYFKGHRVRFGTVVRTLPWGRLLVADLVLIAGTTIGLSLLVVPGVAWLTLFGLVGPVLVQEHHGVIDGFRRTFHLSRQAWRMILVLVVALIAAELFIHELVHELTHHSGFGVQITASWLVSALIGGMVGLIEVALATELMARDPLERPEAD
jgi:hypothetical protein